MANKYVYLFSEGDGSMRNLLGGKGANLAEMVRLGMPVPQGFTVTTEACTRYYDDGQVIAPEIEAEITHFMQETEKLNGKNFGDPKNPLLVSVRSGARASMPGMMDTILNLGLNDEVAAGLIAGNSDPKFARFVYDSYRRFIQMFSDVVMELSKKNFEDIIEAVKEKKGVEQDVDLDVDDMKELVARFKAYYKDEKGVDFPTDPKEQLFEAIKAVFRSWDNPRANVYRRQEGIPYSWGTAVNVQPMVFGNLNLNSGTGVAFTRDPATGVPGLYGDYLINAQGEDVVAGVRTPSPISQLGEEMPEVYAQFVKIAQTLEDHYKDMQDMEFTIENGTLYMLQTRNGKRTAASALRIALDLVAEGVIDEKTAVLRVEPKQLDSLLHPQFDAKALKAASPIAKGIPGSPGAATGRVVFSAEEAKIWADKGEKVVLVRKETCPDDITGMQVSEGILTAVGGKASHAAVVARGMGTCCVVGCSAVKVNYEDKQFTVGDKVYKEGDYVSLDGTSGQVYGEALPTVPATLSDDFYKFMAWADKYRTLKVRTNADTPRDTAQAVAFGAEGIGLCRTEHMFFEAERIKAVREMIVAQDVDARKKALAKILPLQQGDFEEMYRELAGRPMTIRFLDPPLHEFLPTQPAEIAELAGDLGLTAEALTQVVSSLHELNPMMGHRGCRLAVSYPEIAEMQTQAVIRAAVVVNREHPEYNIVPEIMIPLVGEIKELQYVKKTVVTTADAEIAAAGVELAYQVGTMIEIPRAALTADEIAQEAAFFSFGTNDLTQMTFGFSRDDAGTFLDAYYDAKIYEEDPFGTLDQNGVGKLVKMAVELGKKTNPKIKLGICGEHGGDPASVEFCHNIGLHYVSCSPFRVPVARLAAAQAAIKGA
ncbi:MAG: pyruvate, phosphate dikinase [Oscillospiraceae bacterium]|jgi:pyruvate,orthophosphate dikinase|nr:pyruvate, phosphate dikinase [Oscillospiraceae bacterium]